MTGGVETLELVRSILADGRYDTEIADVPDVGRAVLAETAHALVLCHLATWADARERVEHAQAALSRMSAEHPSPRSWDLYVVVVIDDDRDDPIREALEYDTRYARKLVAVGIDGRPAAAEKALLPLLPLRGAAALTPIEPTSAIQAELLAEGIDPELAEAALASFTATGKVVIP